MTALLLINYGSVLFFGIVLTLSFAGIKDKYQRSRYALIFCALGDLQIAAYILFGASFLFKSYPFFTHLPLFLLLKLYYRSNSYIAGISVLSAYLFCTPRKWIGTAISLFWDYDIRISYITQIIITLPLLFLIMKYISPYVARLKQESNRILSFFIIVPLIYYILEYIMTVYTDWLYRGGAVIIEFMDAAVVIVYFIFSVIYLKTLYEKKKVEIEQALFRALANQSIAEIEALRKSELQTAIYRHDLRHHMSYLSACIEKNNLEEAHSYIAKVSEGINNTKVIRYSENETVNLILSSYSAKAADKKIHSEFNITTVDFSKISVPDLCSLLSNALENAINACEEIPDIGKRFLRLHIYSRNNRLCIDIRNSYQLEPVFHQDFPVAKEQGHGFGTKSMAYIVEKYGGVYRFFIMDASFIFQATI
jgi:two-component system sensor histidine kinase AgrC